MNIPVAAPFTIEAKVIELKCKDSIISDSSSGVLLPHQPTAVIRPQGISSWFSKYWISSRISGDQKQNQQQTLTICCQKMSKYYLSLNSLIELYIPLIILLPLLDGVTTTAVGDEHPPAPGISRNAGLGLDGFCGGVEDDGPDTLLVTIVTSVHPATMVSDGSLDLIFSLNFFFCFQIFLS